MAMSGGIDSTVAALMLHDEGYEVVGITMKTWDYASSVGVNNKKKPVAVTSIVLMMPGWQPWIWVSAFILDIREEFGEFRNREFC